jgi:ubiquinol-cytochrome c reductase cytochrome c subunit
VSWRRFVVGRRDGKGVLVKRPRLSGVRFALAVTVLPAVVAGACSNFTEPEPYRPPSSFRGFDPESVRLGQQLYQRDCSFCHGSEGQGTPRGPEVIAGVNGPAMTDFMLRTGRMPIDDPDDPIRASQSTYNDEEIAALVAYLAEEFDQPGPDIPVVETSQGDVAEGQQIYQENCAACHSPTGIGGAMLAERDGDIEGVPIPSLRRAGPVEVGEATRTGPGPMPVFGPDVVDDGQLDSLARYVEELNEPEDRGGWSIGRIGPVMEGAVGWVLGLGVLLMFIFWVGTRAKAHGTHGERGGGA